MGAEQAEMHGAAMAGTFESHDKPSNKMNAQQPAGYP
jgi:hypothetical protein